MKEKKADTVAEHLRATSDKEGQELDIPLHQRLGRARTLTDNLMPRCVCPALRSGKRRRSVDHWREGIACPP